MSSAKREPLIALDAKAQPHAQTCSIVLGVLGKQAGHGQLFSRGGRIVAVRRKPSGEPFVLEIDRRELATILTGLFDFFTPAGPGRPPRHIGPPAAVIDALLGAGEWPFPPLDGLSPVPLLRRDGTLQDAPGYDPANRTFQHPTRELLQDVPRKPSRAQVKYAVGALVDILGEFPFEDRASKTHALALMLTPYLRGVFDGPVPLFVVTGTSPGEGKSLLTRVCGLVATGRLPSILTEGETDQEYRKRITGHLQRGGTYAVFDNVSKPVGADSLAALLTSTIWSDRILGRSVITELPNNSTWLVTGNRVTLAGDIPRRCVLISLRTDQQRAWTRDDFKVPDLLDHVRKHLSPLQAACVTLCRAWGDAGMPEADVPAMGTFESWSRAIGALLAFAGIEGFLTNRDRIQLEGDVAARDMEEFLREVQRCLPATFRARDVLEAVKAGDIEAEALPDELGNVSGQSGAKRIGKAFRRWEGRRVSADGLRIERVERDSRSRTWSWRVVAATDNATRKLARSSP